MFKDELIALQKKANPHNDNLKYIVAEFKEAIKTCVMNGIGQNDSEASFTIVGGKIYCKNPLYNNPTCLIEDIPAIEKVFKEEGISMDLHFYKAPGNGTLTFSW